MITLIVATLAFALGVLVGIRWANYAVRKLIEKHFGDSA